MDYEITHYPEENRFEIEKDGFTAYVRYVLYRDYLDIVHTNVPRQIGGMGIALALVEATYKYAVANQMRPQATCSYAVQWLKKHPEYMK